MGIPHSNNNTGQNKMFVIFVTARGLSENLLMTPLGGSLPTI